jgi:hypothetical protein
MDEQGGIRGPALLVTDSGVPADHAQRLRRFRDAYPDIEIIQRGPWQAVIPEPDGERTIVRWELPDLLDRLETLVTTRLPQAGR